MMFAGGMTPGMAQSRAHVYLLRGLMNIFSLGMDTLATELDRRGVYTTVDNHADWQSLADGAAARYKAGTEGPIILIGHSLGADAVMEMAEYLGRKGVPVALVVPFDGTQSFYASPNVARVLNITQRDYAYMRRGAGFHGTLVNVDVSSDRSIDHLTIDKSPRLHARVIGEVMAVIGGSRRPAGLTPVEVSAPGGADGTDKAAPAAETAKPEAMPSAAPAKTGDGAMNSAAPEKPATAGGTPVIAAPEHGATRTTSDASPAPTPRN
jgi:alpha-beta hydrolase superfamily lysophospholipase